MWVGTKNGGCGLWVEPFLDSETQWPKIYEVMNGKRRHHYDIYVMDNNICGRVIK